MDGGTTVDVVIATYRRPERLATALESVAAAAAAGTPVGWTWGVTVVDDDPAGSAEPVVTNFEATHPGLTTYLRCGSRNISTARNTGLESAITRADWIGSIDDDVVVPAGWIETCARAVADGTHLAVTGPLVKDFSAGPAWLTREPFHRMGVLDGVDGEDAFTCATGNNWVSAAFLRDHPELRFKPELGVTGGEDMDFFYRAVNLGLRPVYSRAAGVTEKEPPQRCTFRYQLRRAFWLGCSEAQVNLGLGQATRARLAARAVRRALNRGAAHLQPEDRRRRGVRYSAAVLAQCAGLLLGTAGLRLSHR